MASTERGDRVGAVLAFGFGTTVAMWTVGYVCRLPLVQAPPAVLGVGMLLALVAGGIFAGRRTGSARIGALSGLLSSVLNLLILGSFLADPKSGASPLTWIPGFLITGTLLSGLGALAGSRLHREDGRDPAWAGALARVAAAATLLLVIAGGLVTGEEAGMDVPDWPQSFNSNMFLYPLTEMTGGIYYEHAHRLFGSLVGLTVIVLAVLTFWREKDRRARVLTLIAVILVVGQGILGGLRVTEDNLLLAAIHGVAGQAIFALIVSVAAATSATWRSDAPAREARGAGTDRKLATAVLLFGCAQVFLGALVRHFNVALHPHITGAVVLFVLGFVTGFRAWGLYGDLKPLSRSGVGLAVLMVVQVGLGLAALVAVGATEGSETPAPVDVLVTTTHQAVGALILATAALIAMWTRRLVTPASAGASPPPSD